MPNKDKDKFSEFSKNFEKEKASLEPLSKKVREARRVLEPFLKQQEHLKSALGPFLKEQEKIKQAIKPLLEQQKKIKQVPELIDHHLSLDESWGAACKIVDPFQEVIHAKDHWQHLMDKEMGGWNALKEIDRIDESWRKGIEQSLDNFDLGARSLMEKNLAEDSLKHFQDAGLAQAMKEQYDNMQHVSAEAAMVGESVKSAIAEFETEAMAKAALAREAIDVSIFAEAAAVGESMKLAIAELDVDTKAKAVMAEESIAKFALAQIEAEAKSVLSQVSGQLTSTEQVLMGLDFDFLVKSHLKEDMTNLASSYGSLADSIKTITELTSLPQFALPGATRELFMAGQALSSLPNIQAVRRDKPRVELELIANTEKESSDCECLLGKIDPQLVRLYKGACESLAGNNPDRARHILTSLRELLYTLLRRLAPDEEVKHWLPKEKKELLYKEKPTRKARILYICRYINHEPLQDFLDKDTDAFVKFLEFLNRVHEPDPKLELEQLKAILTRAESWITYILQIDEKTLR